jgi:LAO/AO transport system kinase
MTMWIPPIIKTISTDGTGIPELAEAVAKHETHLHQSGDWTARDRARLRSEVEAVLQDELMSRFLMGIQRDAYEEILEKVIRRDLSPYEAVHSLLNGKMK